MCGGRQSITTYFDIQVTLSPNEPPVIESLIADPIRLLPDQQSSLACQASDPNGDAVTYEWTTDSGLVAPGSGPTTTFTPSGPGIATVTCRVTDTSGGFATDSIGLNVSSAQAEKALTSGLVAPSRLTVDDSGDLFVVDNRRGGLVALSLATDEEIYSLPIPALTSVALDWSGNLLIGTYEGARVIDRSGNTVELLTPLMPQPGPVADVAVDLANQRYGVLHVKPNLVVIYDQTGTQLLTFGPPGDAPEQLKGAVGLASGNAGSWVVGDSGHGQVKVFDASGTLKSVFGGFGAGAGEFSNIADVATDSNGLIYASDSYQGWIQVFDSAGNALEVLGGWGSEIGELKTAAGLAVVPSVNRLVAASLNTSSLQVFVTSSQAPTQIPGPDPVLAPGTSITFSQQEVGSVSPTQPVSLSNNGQTLLGVRQIYHQGEFSQFNDCPAFLAPSDSCTINVAFAPRSAGAKSGSVVIETSAAEAPITLSLSGSGSVAPSLHLTPAEVSFAPQEIYTVSAPRVVTLANGGGSDASISSIVASGEFQLTHSCPAVLVGGATCAISVRYAPVTALNPHLGQLSVFSNVDGSPHSAALSGEVVVPVQTLIAITDSEILEGDGGTSIMEFEVSLNGPADEPVKVSWAAVADTAAEPRDFLAAAGEVDFAPGETLHTVSVEVVGDSLLEPDEEYFFIDLSGPVNAEIEDGHAVGTIFDNEPCLGPNLLANPSAEALALEAGIPEWSQTTGNNWQPRLGPPTPADGLYFFYAGTDQDAELRQDVDVSIFGERIDAGIQRFVFDGRIRSLYEVSAVAQIVVEFRDATNTAVLASFEVGPLASPTDWIYVSNGLDAAPDPAPEGTRWIRYRLRNLYPGNAYFDDLGLFPMRTATVLVEDAEGYEGDTGAWEVPFEVRMACPYGEDVEIDFATSDLTAAAGEDYQTNSGRVSVLAGDDFTEIPVTIFGDFDDEEHEAFALDSSLVEPTEALLLNEEGRAFGMIFNDDFCARPASWWLGQATWPVTWLEIGAEVYTEPVLRQLLAYVGSDESHNLAKALIAAKLNLLQGAKPEGISTVVEQADAFLSTWPPGSKPNGAAKKEAVELGLHLTEFNNAVCP